MATSPKASMLFAQFIWEAVEKEIKRARKPATAIASFKRLRMVLGDAPRGSSLYEVVTVDKIEAQRTMIQADKPQIWSDEVGAMLDDIIAYLNDDGSEAEKQAADSANGYVGMQTLLLATTTKGATSPAHRLKDKPSLFRIIFEYVATVPFKKRWRIGRQLGEGGHSTVRKCTHCYRYPGKVMALKQIHQGRASPFEVEMLRRETEIIKKLHHDHVPNVYDYVEEDGVSYLVMPMYEGGDMLERIVEKSGNHFTEETCVTLLRDLLSTLAYLHSVGVVHRDIKPENVIFESKDDTSAMYLIDFGFAASGVVGQSLTTACGTPQYAAPEILNGMPHGCEVDLWSLGVVAYVMLSGFPPFYHDDENEMFRLIKRGEFEFPSPSWDPISDNAKDFIRKLLILDPLQRITAKSALKHAWLTSKAEADTHLGLVHSEALKFRARSQWNMAVEDNEESFTLKNMRLAVSRMDIDAGEPDADIGTQADLGYTRNDSVDHDATARISASPVGDAEPLDAEQAEEEANMMRQTIANADGDVDVVMQHYEEVKQSHMQRRSTNAAMKHDAGELMRLQKIVNNQRCEISNLHIELDESKKRIRELEAELAAAKLAGSGITKSTPSPRRSKGSDVTAKAAESGNIKKTVSFGADDTHAITAIRESHSSAETPMSSEDDSKASTKPALPPKPPSFRGREDSADSGGGSGLNDRSISTDSETTTGSDVSPRKKMSIMASATEQMGSFMKAGTRRLRRSPPSTSGSKLKSNASAKLGGHRGSITRLNLHEAGAQFYTMEQLTSGAVESQIDPTRRELYLSDDDFFNFFKLTKDEFLQQPKWKQVSQKKKFRLF